MASNFETADWRTRALQAVGYLGAWRVDFTMNKAWGESGVGRVFGIVGDRMLDGVHLADLDQAYFSNDLDLIKKNRRTMVHHGGHARLEYRLRNPEAERCTWVRSLAAIEVDRYGELLAASGTLFDISGLPPTAPAVQRSSGQDVFPEQSAEALPLGALDKLSGQLVQASRGARSLGLTSVEAELGSARRKVGALLSSRLRRLSTH